MTLPCLMRLEPCCPAGSLQPPTTHSSAPKRVSTRKTEAIGPRSNRRTRQVIIVFFPTPPPLSAPSPLLPSRALYAYLRITDYKISRRYCHTASRTNIILADPCISLIIVALFPKQSSSLIVATLNPSLNGCRPPVPYLPYAEYLE